MKELLIAALSFALLAAGAAAQIPIVRLKPFSLTVNACFERAPDYPDPERVEPHLPVSACVKEISGVLAFSADGVVQLDGAPGPSPRATITGSARYGGQNAEFDAHQVALHVERAPRGYRAWLVADSTPEDPAGDSGRLLVEFRLDSAGRPIAGSALPSGDVACTFAPVCRGEEELGIDYAPEGRKP